MRLEVTALVTLQFSRYAEAAEEVGNQSFCYCRCFLIRNGLHFGPFGKIIHSDQEVSVSLVASREGPCYVNGYSFERSPDIILVHLAPIPGPRPTTGCTGVELSAQFLNICSRLEAVEYLSNLIQGFVNTQVTSRSVM
jgi:hypothetical protein